MWSRRILNKCLIRPLAWLLLRLEVTGLENVPASGPFILMVNHCNFLDPGAAVIALLPREVVLFTKVENLRLPLAGLLFRLYGVVPVERGEADVTAIKRAVKVLLKDRDILLVAPEGTRSYHGRLLPAKNGMAFLAAQTGVPILPVGVAGVKAFWPNVRHFRRTRVRVMIGHPFRFRSQDGVRQDGVRRDGVRKETLDAMTREAMYQLAALLPPEQWGAYADIENATEQYLAFLEPGQSNLAYAGHGSIAGEPACPGRCVEAVQ